MSQRATKKYYTERPKWEKKGQQTSDFFINHQTFNNGHRKMKIIQLDSEIKKCNTTAYRAIRKSDNERAKQMKFITVNEFSLMVIRNCKKVRYDLK